MRPRDTHLAPRCHAPSSPGGVTDVDDEEAAGVRRGAPSSLRRDTIGWSCSTTRPAATACRRGGNTPPAHLGGCCTPNGCRDDTSRLMLAPMFTSLRHTPLHAPHDAQDASPLPAPRHASVERAMSRFAYCTAYMCERIKAGISTPYGQSVRHWPHCWQNRACVMSARSPRNAFSAALYSRSNATVMFCSS